MTIEEWSMADTRSNFLARALDWLRRGYPAGVPRQDYVVLLGLLRRNLTDDEIRQIAAALGSQSDDGERPISREDIEALIKESVLQPASEDDVARVSARLAAGGWPLANPPVN
jgi:hypothetical protein